MKAPGKIYPLSIVGDLLASTPPEEVVFMPDKIYFDGVDTATTPRLAINEEYIRKDALLEWAKECFRRQDEGSWYSKGVADAFSRVIDKLNEM